jgi:hypothetical protein
MTERERWFIEHIGLRVFRQNTNCCEICQRIYEEGLIIQDETHAIYLAEMEIMYNRDGNPLKYFESKADALEFELLKS